MKFKLLFTVFLVTSTAMFSQSKNYNLEITFNSGTFKGRSIFTPEKGNYASQLNLEFFEGVSNINASKLVADNGMQIHYVNRTFVGEAKPGSHEAKSYTSGCGSLNFIDLNNSKPYKKVNGDFTGCTTTLIKNCSAWKTGIVKNRRVVTGSFNDTVNLEFIMDDGSKKTETVDVKIVFKVNESRRK